MKAAGHKPDAPAKGTLPRAKLSSFLALLPQLYENDVIRQFRAWIRQQPWSKPAIVA